MPTKKPAHGRLFSNLASILKHYLLRVYSTVISVFKTAEMIQFS